MVDRDVRADRVLARVEVREQELAAGVLDIAHHARRGVDRALLPHEADAARLVDLHGLGMGEPGLEGFLHRGLMPRRAAMRSPSEARSAASRRSEERRGGEEGAAW